MGWRECTTENIKYHIYALHGISGFLFIYWHPNMFDCNIASLQIIFEAILGAFIISCTTENPTLLSGEEEHATEDNF